MSDDDNYSDSDDDDDAEEVDEDEGLDSEALHKLRGEIDELKEQLGEQKSVNAGLRGELRKHLDLTHRLEAQVAQLRAGSDMVMLNIRVQQARKEMHDDGPGGLMRSGSIVLGGSPSSAAHSQAGSGPFHEELPQSAGLSGKQRMGMYDDIMNAAERINAQHPEVQVSAA